MVVDQLNCLMIFIYQLQALKSWSWLRQVYKNLVVSMACETLEKHEINGRATDKVTYLTLQGGITRSDMSKRVMKHCMSNQLALQFNWFGKKGKRAFGKLKLAKAVQKAVMKCKKCTAAEVELDCREWFRSACDRDGGRKRRQKTNEGVPETPTE
ncbi:uncharacterized protein LOC132743705 isoform X2 [Ruditapes philippinarum]|uniref:uncharacterized protein LOC132743705 isoform X2 n=1 Tax=Ruditapes philippinarum TaxID=129788 RepID=UPI00295AA701|nr:uncharacterized protein LOC132743705 isoform X2 [Ruditapes philippinarum]